MAARITRLHGDSERAHRQLERALDIAEPEGVARPFGRPDEPFRIFLTDHAARGTRHEEFLATCLAHATPGASHRTAPGASLTPREREIFGFLCTRMTATEIAAALFVSVNTVRTHQRSIYRKLGVTNRREAVRFRL